MEKLANVEVGRLPKVTFAKDMFLEARALSQIQLASVLAENTDDNLTLHSDGTSKHGHSYTTLDVKKGDDVLVMGLREVGGADAQSQLDLFKEVLDEIEVTPKKGFATKVVTSIKNLMSDRCAIQKKFNDLFIKYRKGLLPQVTKNWHKLPKENQQSLGNVNEFFCGLHFLVGLADQAEACLKLWENVLFKGQTIGSLAHEATAMVSLEHSVSSEWFARLFHIEVAKNLEE